VRGRRPRRHEQGPRRATGQNRRGARGWFFQCAQPNKYRSGNDSPGRVVRNTREIPWPIALTVRRISTLVLRRRPRRPLSRRLDDARRTRSESSLTDGGCRPHTSSGLCNREISRRGTGGVDERPSAFCRRGTDAPVTEPFHVSRRRPLNQAGDTQTSRLQARRTPDGVLSRLDEPLTTYGGSIADLP
jgi:hypothetical protein